MKIKEMVERITKIAKGTDKKEPTEQELALRAKRRAWENGEGDWKWTD